MITIKAGNATIFAVVRCWYDLILNEIRIFEIVTDGVDSTIRSELDVGNTVQIYRDGNLEFEGTIEEREAFQGGGIVIKGLGQELDITEAKCPVGAGTHKKVYTTSDANTIFADIVGNVSGWSSDVSNSTATSIASFRTTDSQSAWNGIKNLLKRTKKDILVNDSTKTLYLYDELTNSNVQVFNEGVNCGSIGHTKIKAKASKVVVYGKSDGENQIVGSAGSGTPVWEEIDRNIIETAEANARATTELARIVASINKYSFDAFNPSLSFRIGDEVTLNADSVGLDSVTIDIVRIRRGLNQGGNEFLNLEVTNPAYRIASKDNASLIAQLEEKSVTTDSSMQGSGNTLTFPRGNNADNSVPLYINFNVPAEFITDEAGNIRVNSMTLDYDVDTFKQEYGAPSFDGSDPQVQNSSASTAPDVENSSGNTSPGVSGTSASTVFDGLFTSEGSSSNTSTLGVGFNNNLLSVAVSGEYEYLVIEYDINTNFTPGALFHLWVEFDGLGLAGDHSHFLDGSHTRVRGVIWVPIHASVSGNITLDIYTTLGGSFDYSMVVYGLDFSHVHGDGSYATDSHLHPDGTYAAASHPHADGTYDINASDIDNISIGDGVGEAGAENATEVNIYLDYWNGSSWVNKHSILTTGKTLDTNVDLTNSGTYPDAVGFWRVRILTDNANADFVQGIVKIRHLLDNT